MSNVLHVQLVNTQVFCSKVHNYSVFVHNDCKKKERLNTLRTREQQFYFWTEMHNFAMKQRLSVTVVTLILLSPGSLVTSHKAGIEIKSNNTLPETHLYWTDRAAYL